MTQVDDGCTRCDACTYCARMTPALMAIGFTDCSQADLDVPDDVVKAALALFAGGERGSARQERGERADRRPEHFEPVTARDPDAVATVAVR